MYYQISTDIDATRTKHLLGLVRNSLRMKSLWTSDRCVCLAMWLSLISMSLLNLSDAVRTLPYGHGWPTAKLYPNASAQASGFNCSDSCQSLTAAAQLRLDLCRTQCMAPPRPAQHPSSLAAHWQGRLSFTPIWCGKGISWLCPTDDIDWMKEVAHKHQACVDNRPDALDIRFSALDRAGESSSHCGYVPHTAPAPQNQTQSQGRGFWCRTMKWRCPSDLFLKQCGEQHVRCSKERPKDHTMDFRAYDYGNMDRFECHYFQQLAQ